MRKGERRPGATGAGTCFEYGKQRERVYVIRENQKPHSESSAAGGWSARKSARRADCLRVGSHDLRSRGARVDDVETPVGVDGEVASSGDLRNVECVERAAVV